MDGDGDGCPHHLFHSGKESLWVEKPGQPKGFWSSLFHPAVKLLVAHQQGVEPHTLMTEMTRGGEYKQEGDWMSDHIAHTWRQGPKRETMQARQGEMTSSQCQVLARRSGTTKRGLDHRRCS